jgi:hypothetical protein
MLVLLIGGIFFFKYAVEMVSGVMMYIPSFMTIGSGIRVILRLLPQQFESMQCWYYGWEDVRV